jgi:hypothetical protein
MEILLERLRNRAVGRDVAEVPHKVGEARYVDRVVERSLQRESDCRRCAGADSSQRPDPARDFLDVYAGIGCLCGRGATPYSTCGWIPIRSLQACQPTPDRTGVAGPRDDQWRSTCSTNMSRRPFSSGTSS